MSTHETYRVQVLRIGHMPEAPCCGVRMMSRPGDYEPFCYTMLVARSSRRTVVVNAGFPEDIAPLAAFWRAMDPRCLLHRDEDEKVERQLARVGIDPSRVDHLIISPPGPYSTGRIDLFDSAAIHIGRRSWLDVVAPQRDVPPPNPRHVAFPADTLRRLVTDDCTRLNLLDDEDDVCPGIRVFRTGGHHNGSLAVVIDTDRGKVVYADTIFSYGNLDQDVPIGFCRNVDEYHRAVARIRREGLLVVPQFDPVLFERHHDGIIAG